ncbi:multidrug transporter [Endozoicomonas montiporae]|uniref:Multidrug transporter n=2 Tax=Endozoicomonas montiporae TaxID=1027273 RepID=A0A081MZ29_9GAMM|nr:MFS transporter [Endozoicomonas montiporae]KEQ11452.1 multidrug transporter [Endozoicomonas montiporae]
MDKRKFHFQVMSLGHALDHFFVLIFPTVVLVLQKEWGLSYAELLKYGSLGVLAYGLGSLPSGWLGDRWSQRGMMNVYFYGMGLSAILTALAQTPEQLAAGVAAIGLFASIYHPVGTAVVFSTAEKTGRAIAVNGVAGNIGLASAAIVTAFISEMINWQAAFIIPGIVCVLSGFAYSWVSGDVSAINRKGNGRDTESLDRRSMIKLFMGIAVIACLGGLVFQSMTTALPKMVESAFSGSLGQTGMVATIIFVLAATVQMVIGELLDRVPARSLLLVIALGQVIFLILASMVSGMALIPVLICLMFFTFGQIPVNDWLIGHYAADEWRSRFYAMKYTLGLSVATVAYWLIAVVHDNTGEFTLLYLVLAAIMSLSVVAAWFMPKTRAQQAVIA